MMGDYDRFEAKYNYCQEIQARRRRRRRRRRRVEEGKGKDKREGTISEYTSAFHRC